MEIKSIKRYLRSIGMVYAADESVESVLYKSTSNKQLADKIVGVINDRADGFFDPKIDFYELKNEDPALGRAVAGAYDFNHLFKACSWIQANADLIKGEVLEVGCDVGAISCFMALLCPDVHITAIDKSHNGIEASKQLATSLEIKNVDFICCDVKSLVGKKTFDTVVSVKTVNENQGRRAYDCCLSFDEMSDAIVPLVEKYAKTLASVTADSGVCINIEYKSVPDFAYAWVKAMGKNSMNLKPSSSQRYEYESLGSSSEMFAFAFEKSSMISADELYERFNSSFLTQTDLSSCQYQGEEACLFFQNSVRKIEKGVDIFDYDRNPIARYCLYYSDDPTAILIYASYIGFSGDVQVITQNLDIERKKEVINEIDSTVSQFKKQGMIIKNANITVKYEKTPASPSIIRFRPS